MRREGRLVPGAQAGHSGSGSFKLSLQEKSSISLVEKAAAKKSSGAVQRGVKMGKKLSKKVVVKAKKTVPGPEKAKK